MARLSPQMSPTALALRSCPPEWQEANDNCLLRLSTLEHLKNAMMLRQSKQAPTSAPTRSRFSGVVRKSGLGIGFRRGSIPAG